VRASQPHFLLNFQSFSSKLLFCSYIRFGAYAQTGTNCLVFVRFKILETEISVSPFLRTVFPSPNDSRFSFLTRSSDCLRKISSRIFFKVSSFRNSRCRGKRDGAGNTRGVASPSSRNGKIYLSSVSASWIRLIDILNNRPA